MSADPLHNPQLDAAINVVAHALPRTKDTRGWVHACPDGIVEVFATGNAEMARKIREVILTETPTNKPMVFPGFALVSDDPRDKQ